MERILDTIFPGDGELGGGRQKVDWPAILAQELGTPLAAMRMWLDALEKERGPDASVAALRECVGDETRRVNDLVDMARAATGRVHLALVPVDPSSCVRAAVQALKPSAEAKGVATEISLEGAPAVLADPLRLRQIIGNLLSNAVKFTPRGGRVRMTLREADGGVEISVQDEGRGFSRDFERFLFKPFRQEEGGETRSSEGLGLGLALVRRLVRLHRGTVKAKSAGPGRGSTFTVWLPSASR